MNIPDNQKIAIYWNNKIVGLVVGRLTKPSTLNREITILSWHGECLGEEIGAQSPNEVYKEARRIAHSKGLHGIFFAPCDDDVVVIHTPAFEE